MDMMPLSRLVVQIEGLRSQRAIAFIAGDISQSKIDLKTIQYSPCFTIAPKKRWAIPSKSDEKLDSFLGEVKKIG